MVSSPFVARTCGSTLAGGIFCSKCSVLCVRMARPLVDAHRMRFLVSSGPCPVQPLYGKMWCPLSHRHATATAALAPLRRQKNSWLNLTLLAGVRRLDHQARTVVHSTLASDSRTTPLRFSACFPAELAAKLAARVDGRRARWCEICQRQRPCACHPPPQALYKAMSQARPSARAGMAVETRWQS